MKIEHLKERIDDYKDSIETVVEKKIEWKNVTKKTLFKTLKTVVKKYDIGWRIQELNWMNSNEAINITLDSFPPELITKTNQIPSYQFIQGAALVFSQSYNGNVYVFMMFPIVEPSPLENNSIDLGIYNPHAINEKLIMEKIDEFLKEMIQWELPAIKGKIGY